MSDTASSKVVDFLAYRSTVTAQVDHHHVEEAPAHDPMVVGSGATREATVGELYSSEANETRALSELLKSLEVVGERLSAALSFMDDEDFIGADNEVTIAQPEIAEAFVHADSERGSAAIILAIYYALSNRRGQPLERNQLLAIHSCVRALSKDPFLGFIQALPMIAALNRAGLSTDPAMGNELEEVLAN